MIVGADGHVRTQLLLKQSAPRQLQRQTAGLRATPLTHFRPGSHPSAFPTLVFLAIEIRMLATSREERLYLSTHVPAYAQASRVTWQNANTRAQCLGNLQGCLNLTLALKEEKPETEADEVQNGSSRSSPGEA